MYLGVELRLYRYVAALAEEAQLHSQEEGREPNSK
jgi:hypothetical protein